MTQTCKKHKKEDSGVTLPKDTESSATESKDTETRNMPNKDLKHFLVKMTSDLEEDTKKQMSSVRKVIRTRIGKPTTCRTQSTKWMRESAMWT